MQKLRKYFKQSGQGIVEYALLLAFIVGLAGYIYTSGLPDSVKEAYNSVSSTIAALSGEKTDKEKDEDTANKLAQLMYQAMLDGRVTFKQTDNQWLSLYVVRNADGTFSTDGAAVQHNENLKIDDKYYTSDNGGYRIIWNNIINASGSGLTQSSMKINDEGTGWYGVRVDMQGNVSYYVSDKMRTERNIDVKNDVPTKTWKVR